DRIARESECEESMSGYKQLKVGPELLNPSRESWLGYYVFAAATLGILAGGNYLLRRSGLEGASYWLALLGLLTLALISAWIAIVCHLMGHLFDELDELKVQISDLKKGGDARQ